MLDCDLILCVSCFLGLISFIDSDLTKVLRADLSNYMDDLLNTLVSYVGNLDNILVNFRVGLRYILSIFCALASSFISLVISLRMGRNFASLTDAWPPSGDATQLLWTNSSKSFSF